MSKLTVKVPTSTGATRPAVARQTIQVSLNRSVPPVTEDVDRTLYSYSPTKNASRVAPTTTSSTNEFGTSRTPRGASQTREGAGTKIVDLGRNVELRPRGKFNVRGVGADGFFPPVKLRTGTSGVRFSTSAGSVRSKSAQQTPAPSPSPLNVELAPAKAVLKTASEPDSTTGHYTDDWSLNARPENLAKTHTLQDKPANPYRPANPYNTKATLTASRETFLVKESSPSPSPMAFKATSDTAAKAGMGSPATSGPSAVRPASKDAAWVRSFKVKQRRHNRVKDLMETKPAGLALASPTNMGDMW